MNREPEGSARPGTLGTLGARLLNFTSVLAVGKGAVMLLAVARIAVLTRLLEVSTYGQLTLLVIAAGLVTIVCRMAVVTGTLLAAFRGGDEDTGAEEDPEEAGSAGVPADQDSRRLLGTGLVASLGLTVAFTAGAAAASAPLGQMLLGSQAVFVLAAAAALGGLDATFHLVSTIARFERRAGMFVGLQALHALLGLAVAALLIRAGYGLEGAIGGLLLGTAIALAPALWVSRHRFSLHVSANHLATLTQKGAPLLMITLGFWLFRHADIFMVSRYLPEDDVALYRVAARIGAITSALLGGVLLARGPLLQGPLRGALHREGLLVTADARLVTYLWLAAVWMLVGLVLMSDLLIKVAPPEYESAAPLIPLLGLAAISTTALTVVYRTSRLKRKRHLMVAVLMIMSPVLIVLSILLIPVLGLEGAAIAAITPPTASAALYIAISQRHAPAALDLPWARLLAATCAGAAYAAGASAMASALATGGVFFSAAATLAFPGALVLIRVIPRTEIADLLRIISLSRLSGSDWSDGIALLGSGDVVLLDDLLRKRRPVGELARSRQQSEEELLARLVEILRELGGVGSAHPGDPEVARYLLSPGNVGQRNREGHYLALRQEIDPMDIDRLTELAARIESMNAKRWKSLTGL